MRKKELFEREFTKENSKKKEWPGRRKFLGGCALLTVAGFLLTISGVALGGTITGIRLNAKGFQVSAPLLNPDDTQAAEAEQRLEPFNGIEIALDYADVRIEPSDSDQYAISYYMDRNIDLKCDVTQGKLTVRQDHPFSVFTNEIAWFSIGNYVTSGGKDAQVIVYVPKEAKLDTVSIKTDSGSVTCSSLHTDTLRIEADYGAVRIQDVQAGILEAVLESGSLELEQVSGGSGTLRSDYGDVRMERVVLTEDMKLDVESGNIKCTDVSMRDFVLESSYGNFDGENMKFRNVEADVESGNCKLTKAAFDNWNMELEYGDVQLQPAKPMAEYKYNLKTEYGDITINGENMGASFQSLFDDAKKDNIIKINCESGNIKLE